MFSLNMKPYAITGTSSRPLAPNVAVDVRDSKRVQICTMDAHGDVVKTSAANAWGASLGDSRRECETLGSFSIEGEGEGEGEVQGSGSGEFGFLYVC